MTAAKAFKPKVVYIDQAPLVGSTKETKTLRKVEQLSAPDEFDYIVVRPYGSTQLHIHSRWIRQRPTGT